MKIPIWLMIGTVMLMIVGLVLMATVTGGEAEAQPAPQTVTADKLSESIDALTEMLAVQQLEVLHVSEELKDVVSWRQKIIEAAEQHEEPTAEELRAEARKRTRKRIQAWGPIYDRPESSEVDLGEIGRVSNVMNHYLKKAPRRTLAKDEEARWEFAHDIYHAALDAEIPHILWTYQVFKESSYRMTALGDVGEEGLTQVHGRAAEDCDLQTRLGQLRCGANWMSKCFEKCGTWEGALTAYASGHCTTSNTDTQDAVLNRVSKWMELEAAY